MTLILNQLFTNSKSGIVTIEVPVLGEADSVNKGPAIIKGILASDPRIQVQNQWGNILPSTDDLNQLLQAAGSRNLFSWVSASSAAWKSSEPISLGLDFYLISYNRRSHIKGQISSLMSLAGLAPGGPSNTFGGDTQVKVHGGYGIDILESNSSLKDEEGVFGYLSNAASKLMGRGKQDGTISVTIGDQIHLHNLLLQDCTAEPSTVQVELGVPLYIKVTTVMRMYRAPLVSDIVGIFS